MSEHNITVEGGSSVRLPIAGKYCDRDILITASSSGNSGTTAEDLTAELTEQDELLTSIEAALGLKTIPATLTVNFANEEEEYDEETDDDWMEYYSWATTGSYTIDDGEAVYFEDESSLSIEAFVGSVIKISIGNEWGDLFSTRNAIGCEGDYLCENQECSSHLFGGCAEGVIITITDETASVMVYSVYY